jgi:Protein of unknown function (DUF3154).
MGFDITGIGSIFDFGSKILDKVLPDKEAANKAKLELMLLQQNGEFKELELQTNLALEQIKANAIQAANPSVFVSGARPAIMWVCVAAYAYNYVGMPLLVWLATWYDKAAPAMITLDTTELTTLLFGMLGISGMRTLEKIKGVASK